MTRKVSIHDAKLFQQALDLSHFFVTTEDDPNQPGGLEGQEDKIKGVMGQVFASLADQLNCGTRDMEGVLRATEKARALYRKEHK